MKNLIITLIVIVLVILFGTIPLSILSKIFEYIAKGLQWLAKILNFFGWNGMI